ncbi:MAG: type III-B CRISPR module RAMP protein Cmr1 [Flavobacteriaceae bacterium]|nr:MAG: type III-B CRISPR module RAMP protein Cmr1 [Flavobacteriaceae bacterium]
MKTIETTYRIVTPMFIGGADQDPSDGIRPPSFKGALRFWWRALHWGNFLQKENNNEEAALKALHQKEGELFGRAAKMVGGEQVGGQGCFLLTISKQPNMSDLVSDWPKANTGAGYLAYGILENKGGKSGKATSHKKGIKEGSNFTVQLVFKNNAEHKDIESIEKALEVLGLLGALGSRGSRRGMGSISLLKDGKLMSMKSYKNKLTELFSTQDAVAPYTTISRGCSYQLEREYADARKALDAVGKKYKDHRKEIVKDEHKRIPFGLPLPEVEDKLRRSSPMLIHVQATSDQLFVPVVVFMPSKQFHPNTKYQSTSFVEVKRFVEEASV